MFSITCKLLSWSLGHKSIHSAAESFHRSLLAFGYELLVESSVVLERECLICACASFTSAPAIFSQVA